MKIRELILATVAAVALGAAPVGVLAQQTPQSGDSGSGFWNGLPIGSEVIIGGLVFVVTAVGLVLLDDDDGTDEVIPPPPPPPPPPASSSPSSSST